MRREWFPTLDRLKIRRRGYHAARHTHATLLLAAGHPIAEVSKRLGHASVQTTLSFYAHTLPGGDDALARELEGPAVDTSVDTRR
jgi:integrase